MLAGAADASVAVYDIQRATDYEGDGLIAKHDSLFVVDKQHEHGHRYAISSATWYPIDTGLFITGSYDHHINVWDTNTTQVLLVFTQMPCPLCSRNNIPVFIHSIMDVKLTIMEYFRLQRIIMKFDWDFLSLLLIVQKYK